jgi:hypothetical protein
MYQKCTKNVPKMYQKCAVKNNFVRTMGQYMKQNVALTRGTNGIHPVMQVAVAGVHQGQDFRCFRPDQRCPDVQKRR